MKVLFINGSPHKDGSVFTAMNEVMKTLENEGIETELIHVGAKAIRGCVACRRCTELGRCAFDDEVNAIAEKFKECDGLVVGSPVYYAAPNSTLVALLDRLFYSSRFPKTMKVGAAIVSARRGGCTATFDALNKYFAISGMPIVTSQYWNMIHGNSAADALQDAEGLQTMRTLGKNMAFMLKAIALGKEKYGIPEKEPQIRTNFIR
ncbi:MAG: flavodoxin family protein [Clostridia bacterium]|nr:flavodoxin family protein [Clostridia bacterium]